MFSNEERNELLMKYGEADEQIKRLKRQSAEDSNRYEQLLNQFAQENSQHIETAKKKLYKEYDAKLEALSAQCQEYKDKFEGLQRKWDENEDSWNHKFDLVVSERNAIKRKAKSLQHSLSDLISKNDKNGGINDSAATRQLRSSSLTSMGSVDDFDDAEDKKLDAQRMQEIERLKAEIIDLKKGHQNEKTALLQSIQRLSSQSAVSSQKGSDMGLLVNTLSTLISEKEEIIESLTQSKKFLGHRLLETEKELQKLKK